MIKINKNTDALLIVDVQNDFVSGSLAVPNATDILPIINKYISKLPTVICSKDWHPDNHSSFSKQGGPWPDHCIMGTKGAELHNGLAIDRVLNIYKGSNPDIEQYSAFDNTKLNNMLTSTNINRLFVCGLATDYCVKATVLDALKIKDVEIYLLTDAIKAVNVNEGDGEAAIKEMVKAGAKLITIENIQN